ncbi:MAG: hypothetical protein LBH25_00085 [Fibromonadaceae bacterium]|jgi:hypothetical protein|nr:hypothetical protein [Fibromonadaceae bacterium]
MNEIAIRLRNALGEEVKVEVYERMIKLYEKIALFKSVSAVELSKTAFEMMTLSILESLRASTEQIAKLYRDENMHDSEHADREKFLSLIADLLKSGMITSHECETALKYPEKSSLPWILGSIKDEAEDLFTTLIIGYPCEVEETVKKEELDCLLAKAAYNREV